MYVLTYDGAWQRHDGRAETDADQHAASRSSSQPSRLVDEHQPKDCLVENGSRAKKARSGRVAQIPGPKYHTPRRVVTDSSPWEPLTACGMNGSAK